MWTGKVTWGGEVKDGGKSYNFCLDLLHTDSCVRQERGELRKVGPKEFM